LFGINEPGCFAVLDLERHESILFIPNNGIEYEVWCGKVKPCKFYQDKYGVDHVDFVENIQKVLDERHIEILHTLYGKNSDSGNFAKEAEFKGRDSYRVINNVLFSEFQECRVIKSKNEIQLMQYVNDVSSAAHVQVMKEVKEGMMEYEMEAIFKYYCQRRGNCRYSAYTCICGSGHACATLHYGHAGAPNDKTISNTDMLLLDMGAEYHGYCSDITCSYPASGKFSNEQKIVYNMVLAAQKAVISSIKPGVLWSDMHRLAEGVICEQLLKNDFIRENGATVEELVEKYHIVALFFPHGLGHLLGLDTHDVGGYPSHEAPRPDRAGVKKLRTNRLLKPGMVLTVEPGVYFIEALLKPALSDKVQSSFLNESKIQSFMSFGGVRLEDDIVVTDIGCHNLTNCPRTVEDIESVMAGGEWPKKGQDKKEEKQTSEDKKQEKDEKKTKRATRKT